MFPYRWVVWLAKILWRAPSPMLTVTVYIVKCQTLLACLGTFHSTAPAGLLLDPRHGRDGGGAGAGPQPLHPRLRPRDRDAAVRHAQRGLPQRRDRHAETRGGH